MLDAFWEICPLFGVFSRSFKFIIWCLSCDFDESCDISICLSERGTHEIGSYLNLY